MKREHESAWILWLSHVMLEDPGNSIQASCVVAGTECMSRHPSSAASQGTQWVGTWMGSVGYPQPRLSDKACQCLGQELNSLHLMPSPPSPLCFFSCNFTGKCGNFTYPPPANLGGLPTNRRLVFWREYSLKRVAEADLSTDSTSADLSHCIVEVFRKNMQQSWIYTSSFSGLISQGWDTFWPKSHVKAFKIISCYSAKAATGGIEIQYILTG